MTMRSIAAAGSVLGLALFSACADRASLEPPSAAGTGVARGLDQLSAPLSVQQVEVTDVEGYRAVFLRLSRLPGAVSHRADNDPARITVDIQGPTSGETAEERLRTDDTLIWQVRVSTQTGNLRVIIDMRTDVPPVYAVETLADWVMVRLQPSA